MNRGTVMSIDVENGTAVVKEAASGNVFTGSLVIGDGNALCFLPDSHQPQVYAENDVPEEEAEKQREFAPRIKKGTAIKT